MARSLLAILTLLALVAPVTAEGAALDVSSTSNCRVTAVPMDVPGCRVWHAGTAQLVGCEGDACIIALSLEATATGFPAGLQDVEVAFLADEVTLLCSAERTSTGDGAPLGCGGAATVSVSVPAQCRLVLVSTTATGNAALKASAYSELRVCKAGTLESA